MTAHDQFLAARSAAKTALGRTSEGFDLLSGIRVGDLPLVQSSKRPDRIVSRVQSIIEQHPDPEVADLSVMEALAGASKAGDRGATELLVFGDLEELIRKNSSSGPSETARS
jgi:hypothetical protein